MKNIKYLMGFSICVFMTVGVIGCSSDSDSTASESDGTSTPDGSNDTLDMNTAFDGTWVQGCTADDPDDPETEYATTVLTIAGDTATSETLFFTDPVCQESSPGFQSGINTNSVVYPGGTTTTSRGDATHIDLTLESLLINGEPPPEGLADLAPIGEVTFDIALIEGNTLFVGDDSRDLDGSTADLRPTMLDTINTFSRQQ